MPTEAVVGSTRTDAVVPLLTRGQLRLLQSLSVCPAYLNDVLFESATLLVDNGLAALIACPAADLGGEPRWRCEITQAGRRFLVAGP